MDAQRDSTVTYRRAGPDDAADLAPFVAATEGGEVAPWRERIAGALADEGNLLLAAYAREQIVGLGKANWADPAGADDPAPAGYYCSGLLVVPAWRRRGLGTALTSGRLAWIWTHDERAWCFTAATNAASLALHARVGFTEVGRSATYRGHTFDGGVGVLLQARRPGRVT